jgi:alpha-galactosidase/6-phospho-beta-glucosidase family protein
MFKGGIELKNLKIVIAGGGSCFVLSKIKILLEKKDIFEGSEICLFDIDPHYLPLLIKASNELCKKEKVNLKITSTLSAKEAFENASFIYFVWNVGGREVLKNDIEIPCRYNIQGDETAGIGGTLMAQRHIPVAINYCKMIEKICPDAWIISLVNPTNLITNAVRREANVKFISLCDCFCDMAMNWLPTVLNMPPVPRHYHVSEDLRPRSLGINHFTWIVDIMVNGKDGYPLLRKIIRESKEKVVDLGELAPPYMQYNLFEAFDYVDVAPFHTMGYYENRFCIERDKDKFDDTFYAVGLGWNKDRESQIKKISEGADYNEFPFGDYRDYCFHLGTPRQLIGVMASIITNDGREWGGSNFPNDGIISNLTQGAIVEGPATYDAKGQHPIPMGELPKPFVGKSLHLINWSELSVDAALSGDKKILYQAILENPLILDMREAKEAMNEMLIAYKRYLPQYKID